MQLRYEARFFFLLQTGYVVTKKEQKLALKPLNNKDFTLLH